MDKETLFRLNLGYFDFSKFGLELLKKLNLKNFVKLIKIYLNRGRERERERYI